MSHALMNAPSEIDETTEANVAPEIVRFDRVWALDDIEIVRSGQGGDGRVVDAYAAVFDQEAEIQDQHGHYIETIDRSAFRRALSHPGAIDRCQFLWNHGYGVDGNPSAIASVPIGRLLDIKSDDRGLLTRARFNKSELAEHVLEAIKAGDVRGYSFRGRVFQSDPMRVPRIARGGALPRVRRIEMNVSDVGPTGVPWYPDSQIVAVRSRAIAEAMRLPERERIVIARALLDPADVPPQPIDLTESEVDEVEVPEEGTEDAPVTPDPDESDEDTVEADDPTAATPTPSDEGPGTEGSPTPEAPLPVEMSRSLTAAEVARRARVALILRGGE